MPKPEWGTKRVCPNCYARFYDMQRQPITCPKCSSTFDPEVFTKKRRGRPPSLETKSTPSSSDADESVDVDIAEDLSSFEETDEVLEDTSDFGEDEKVVDIEPSADED